MMEANDFETNYLSSHCNEWLVEHGPLFRPWSVLDLTLVAAQSMVTSGNTTVLIASYRGT
jgi:hypothetical protein